MEEAIPQDNEENNNNEGSERDKKKKKKKHKHRRKHGSESEDEEKKTIEKKNQSVIKDLIADCFVLLHVIGKGAFGQIYLSYNLRENLPVSIKKEEKKPGKIPQLKTESKIYQSLLNIQADDISGSKPLGQDEIPGVPKFYGVGELPDCYYMIIDFLGPNLLELFNYCGCKKFTISTICLIALQVLNRIENLHKHHYIHRDIKPENFLIGIHDKSNMIYLIDFGLSRRYKNAKTHQHIPYREGRSLIGTARYVSINTHLGIEQSRRDDLESIGYMLVFFLKGVLPWQGLKNCNEKYIRIMEKKLQIPTEILCYGLPDEITYYLNYTKSLRFEDRPDYDYLRGLFVKLLGTCNSIYGLTKEMLRFDWCFEDPATSIWPIFNKKNKGLNASNLNSSFTKDKDKSEDEDNTRKKNDVIKLKKQLSNIAEVNDFVSNENNPNYERSDTSESGGTNKKDNNKDKKKKEIVDKNLIKEESESKADESEETVRESFQPIPQDLEAGKLNEELKNVFFQQAKEEGIDKYINKLMNPSQESIPNQQKNIDLLKFDKEEKNPNNIKINNNQINNTYEINSNFNNNNNKEEKLRAIKKPSLEKIKEESEKKELISSGESGDKKKGEKLNDDKEKESEEKKSISVNNIKKNIGESTLIEDEKLDNDINSNKNSKESKKSKGREGLNVSAPIVEAENTDGKRALAPPMINSKNVSKEMESKLKDIEGKNKLNFEQIDINKKLNEDEKDQKNEEKDNENVQNNLINNEKKKEDKKEEKQEDKIEDKKKDKKEDNNEDEKKEVNVEIKENNDKANAKLPSNKDILNENQDKKEKQSLDKISDHNALPKILKEESIKKDEKDNQYKKSFKTTKAKKKNINIQDNSVAKSNERKKSFKTENKITPGEPTPGGETPSGNDSLQKMKVSKENLIKISMEPVANYYSIVKDLGHGSYGQVKKVKHKQLNEIRAMKITNKKSDSSKYEIEILRKISHPNITNIFEIFADSKKFYVIMEFLEGGELFEAITSIGSFTEASACKVMRQILQAVYYLHSNRIVHRDLKPENIMLTQKPKNGNYQIKLIDFGTAKMFKPGKKMNKFIGTSYYIAPEVLKERYDEKCDVWSCGVILFILLCGYPPFNGNTNVDIFHAINNQNPIFGGEEWEDITQEAKDLIKLMLKKNPNERLSAEMCLRHKWFRMLDDLERNKNTKNFKQIQINAIQHMSQFVKENRFKQAVLQFISTQFNIQKEEGDLRDLFKSMDVSGTGQLTKEEFSKKLIELYGENDGKEMATNIFNSLDLDGSGKISYDEFLSAMINSKKVVTEERLEKAFKMFDKDNSGKLSVKEIRNVFGGSEEQWKQVINEVDLNNDGEVDFGEFKIMMINMNKNNIIQRKKTSEKSKGISDD